MNAIANRGVKSVLFEKRNTVLKSAKDGMKTLLSGEVRETLGLGFDEGDMAVISQIEDMRSTLFGKQIYVIKSIDEALRRLNNGTYNLCDECDDEIGEDRLKAIPFTRYCRNCQERHEEWKRVVTISW